jgi:hypothetical protein
MAEVQLLQIAGYARNILSSGVVILTANSNFLIGYSKHIDGRWVSMLSGWLIMPQLDEVYG